MATRCDHLVPVQIGGSNAVANLWPQHYAAPWGVRAKDRLDVMLRTLVCSGRLSLDSARRQEATNWIKAYKRYVSGAANARLRDLPRHRLTPGAHVRVGTAGICKAGYVARVPSPSHRQRAAAFRRYHLKRFWRGPLQGRSSGAGSDRWLECGREPVAAALRRSLGRAREGSPRRHAAHARLLGTPVAGLGAPAGSDELDQGLQALCERRSRECLKTHARHPGATRAAGGSPGDAGARAPRPGEGRAHRHDSSSLLLPVVPADLGDRSTETAQQLPADAGPLSTVAQTVKAQIADMQYANVRVGLASWFGPNSTTDTHWPALFQAAQGTGFSWAPYYEERGPLRPARPPRSPPICTTCARRVTAGGAGTGHDAGRADARVRLQHGRSRQRPRLRDRDALEAGDGNDTLIGGFGADKMDGGPATTCCSAVRMPARWSRHRTARPRSSPPKPPRSRRTTIR